MHGPRKIAVTLVAAVAIAPLFGACGGGDSDDSERGDPTSARPSARTEVPSETTTARPQASPTARANANDLEELRGVRDRFVASTFSATYENRGPATAEFVPVRVFKDGQIRYRVDFVGQRDGQSYSGSAIVDQGTAYTCGTGELARAVGGDEAGVCVLDPRGAGNPLEGLFGAFTVDENIRIVQRSERQIAGRTGQCYTTEHALSGASGTLCVDATGALLSLESADANATNIVAMAVTDAVSDTDFAPPYEVRELPEGQ